jgi:DNA polymerase-3 subunit delta
VVRASRRPPSRGTPRLGAETLQLDALAKELKKGTIRPAYLLAGEEALHRDDALDALKAAVLDGAADDFNYDRLDGSRTTPQTLLESVERLPVMAQRRLVLLSEPEGRRSGAKALVEALPDVVKSLREGDGTVLVVTTPKVDKRSRFYKAFADPAAVVECEAPKNARSLHAFIAAEAKRQGVEIAAGVPELLAERIGPQLLLLRHEVAKASLLAGPGEVVTRANADASVAQVAEEPIWDLTDAIGEGRGGEAIALLARLLDGGNPGQPLLGALASHFRKLATVRGGGSVPGPPFIKQKLEQQARRYPPRRLETCLRAIHRADVELKGGSVMRPERALEQLVLGLAG